ncbi:MAG: hypothetical protein ACK523_02645, partial [Pirellulaceae bacterium]
EILTLARKPREIFAPSQHLSIEWGICCHQAQTPRREEKQDGDISSVRDNGPPTRIDLLIRMATRFRALHEEGGISSR